MLALYEPHNVVWFFPVFGLGVLLFFLMSVRKPTPVYLRPFQIASWCMAAGSIIGMILLKSYDNAQLRKELQAVVPAEASNVTVGRFNVKPATLDTATATRVLAMLREVKSVAAHHSHPVEPVTIAFDFRGEHYDYRVGRDSSVANEYWVINMSPACARLGELEIGRLQTAEWAPLIDGILKEKK